MTSWLMSQKCLVVKNNQAFALCIEIKMLPLQPLKLKHIL